MAPEIDRPSNTSRNNNHNPLVTDPTFLTTQQLLREYTSLKELVFTRLDAMDKAMELFNENITRVPTDTDKQIGQLKTLMTETFRVVDQRFNTHDQKFIGIGTQFAERDERTQKTAELNQKAIDAALQAQKESAGAQTLSLSESIAKSETGTTKEIDGIKVLISSGNKAVEDKVNDLKGRLDRGEGKSSGHGDVWGYVVGGFGILMALSAMLFELLRH